MNEQAFNRLTKIPFVRNKLFALKRIYQNICPYEDERAEKIAMEALSSAIIGTVFITAFFFFINLVFCGATPFTFIATFFTGYFAFSEMLFYHQEKTTKAFQEDLSSFYMNVSHYYQSEKSILNALSKGSAAMNKDIQITARFIADILSAEDAETKIYSFVTDADKNLYLKLFLQQCYECFEHGDEKVNEISTFTDNVENFRVDMLKTKIEKEKHNAKLEGLSFVIWFPVLMMGFIKKFGITLTEEMFMFYAKYGLFVECAAFVAAFFLYYSLNKTKYQQFKAITVSSTYYKLQESLQCFTNVKENWFTKQLKAVSCNVPISVCYTKIVVDCLAGICVGFLLVALTAIQNHVLIQPIQLLLALSGGLVTLLFPLKILMLKHQFKKDREFEIDAIQLLMISEMNSKTVTLADLLTKMERLASYYKSAIGECLTTLSFDQTKALNELKTVAEKEKDFALSSIVDMLISIDRIGIRKAFSELKVNRQLGMDERHILSEIKANKKKNLHELSSALPAVISVGLYVMAPFLYFTLIDLSSAMESLEAMNSLF